jgi:hypothetical protein
MRSKKGWLVAVATLVLLPATASGAQFSLYPNVQLSGGYNSNITTTSTNQKGDFLGALSPGFRLDTDTAARDFALNYQTMMLTYLNYSNKDRFGQDNYFLLSDLERLGKDTTLTFSDSFLMGSPVSSGLMINGPLPVGPQFLQALLNQSTTTNNNFSAQFATKFAKTFRFSATAFQNFFIGASNSVSKYSFSQGAILSTDRLIGQRVTVGFSYQFSDFRFSSGSVPTTDSHWPQVTLGWGAGTPFSVLAQVGPVIASSSSGIVGSRPQPARTTVNAGWALTGNYTGRRLTVTASLGQQPSLSAGFGGFATSQSYTGTIQYKLTRRATVYANGGYYQANGTGFSDKVVSYGAGVSYRLIRVVALTAGFLGYQTQVSGVSPASVGAATQGTTNTKMIQIGLIFTPEPFKWNY